MYFTYFTDEDAWEALLRDPNRFPHILNPTFEMCTYAKSCGVDVRLDSTQAEIFSKDQLEYLELL